MFAALCFEIPYFFDYKMEFLLFQNSPKRLDLSYEMGLDLVGLFWKDKNHIIANFQRTDSVISCHSREGKSQEPVVQSIVSLTTSLRGQLLKCFTTL